MVGEEIENALQDFTKMKNNTDSDMANKVRQNMVYYLVAERPYFCRLILCNKPTIMDCDGASVLKKILKTGDSDVKIARKFLFFSNDPSKQCELFKLSLVAIVNDNEIMKRQFDETNISLERKLEPTEWLKNIGLLTDEMHDEIKKDTSTDPEQATRVLEKIIIFKKTSQFALIKLIQEANRLIKNDNLGYDDSVFTVFLRKKILDHQH